MATLFSKAERGREVRMIQILVSGGRRTIRLGPVNERSAQRFRDRIEALVGYRRLNQQPDADMTKWLSGLDPGMHRQLANAGLVEGREHDVSTLGAFVARYISMKERDLAPASIRSLRLTEARLVARFGSQTRLDRITSHLAADWRAAMLDEELSEASVRVHTRNARAFFNAAIEAEIITKNPIRGLPTGSVAANRERYVTTEEADRVLAALPDAQWRALFGLARFAGLRCPSETHGLRWTDIDLARGRMSVYATKTRTTRVVPIVPRLRTILDEAFKAREPDIEEVIALSMNNLHRTVIEAIEKAGLSRWPDLFQTLRRSAETDFAMMNVPQHAVSAWIGHSVAVSVRHYLQVPAELYERAAGITDQNRLRIADSGSAA
ncbi:MAG: tyrosine-type recombinase/integrase [Phycisphaerae bacterium]|nr:tyrosine-type recombinase/integrase [Phycisphaerae bacterium]